MVLSELRATDRALGMRRPTAPAEPRPIVLTDWSARLASDWTYLDARFDNLADGVACDLIQAKARLQYGTHVATAPLLSELTELRSVTLPGWRKALVEHAESELALIDAELAVSL